MKIRISIIIGILCFFFANAQSYKKQTVVFVHGAWGGGWVFKKMDSLLTEKGYKVYRPTLTGLGERVHLASPEISLDMHIQDIINFILYENITNVIVIGHSYGGMVATGVADRIPDRIGKLIYVDALVPQDGESAFSILGTLGGGNLKKENGFIFPDWVSKNAKIPSDVPHPEKTWYDHISLKNPNRLLIPTTYILTVAKNSQAKNDWFYSQAQRAKKNDWAVFQLEADHNPHWSAPIEFLQLLVKIFEDQ